MIEEDLEIAIKVVVVGNGAVGKSSMIQSFDGDDVLLMLWDTAGQEEFDSLTKAYYRGAQACVIAFSTTDRDSFMAVETWRQKVEEEVGPDIPTCLIQNKIDLIDDAVITQEEAEDLAKRLKMRFYRTSVKEDLNVNDVFQYLAQQHLKRIKKEAQREENEPQPGRQIGVFNTASSSATNYSSAANRTDTITLQPNKSRGKKRPAFLSNCTVL